MSRRGLLPFGFGALLGGDGGRADEHILVAVAGGGDRGSVYAGRVLEQAGNLGLNVLRYLGVHIELHLGAAREVNAQVEQVLAERQQDESDKTAVKAVNRQKNLFISVGLG